MGISDVFQVFLFSILSLLTLFVLTKLLGNRQMSQLTMFDYIIGISFGSIAAEMASHPDEESWLGLLAMLIYAGVAYLMNFLNTKSIRIRNVLLGNPVILYQNGTLYFDSLKKAKIDLCELLTSCRNSGYFDLSELYMIILEVNGKLSFLPMEAQRPLTPEDMGQAPAQQKPVIPVIMDGRVRSMNLEATGNNETWLYKQMEMQGYRTADEILLATVSTDNQLAIYERNEDKVRNNPYT